MKTKGINDNFWSLGFEYGTQEYFEISLKSMMDSCFAYGSIEIGSYNYETYIKPKQKDLPTNVFDAVYKEHYDYLNNNCMVVNGTYTDSEGCIYNSIVKKI